MYSSSKMVSRSSYLLYLWQVSNNRFYYLSQHNNLKNYGAFSYMSALSQQLHSSNTTTSYLHCSNPPCCWTTVPLVTFTCVYIVVKNHYSNNYYRQYHNWRGISKYNEYNFRSLLMIRPWSRDMNTPSQPSPSAPLLWWWLCLGESLLVMMCCQTLLCWSLVSILYTSHDATQCCTCMYDL